MDGGMAGDDPVNPSDDPNKIKSEGLKFVFMINRDNFPNNSCTYYEDGNPEMYTKENMDKRKDLSGTIVVRDSIEEFIMN